MRLELQKAEVDEATDEAEESRAAEEDLPQTQGKNRRRRRKTKGVNGVSQAGFLVVGLQLEDMQ